MFRRKSKDAAVCGRMKNIIIVLSIKGGRGGGKMLLKTPFTLGPKHKMQRPDLLYIENLFSTPFLFYFLNRPFALLLDKFYWRHIICYSKIFNYSFNFCFWKLKIKKHIQGLLRFMATTAALLQHHTVLYSRDCLLYRNKLLCTRDSSLLYTHTLILIRHYMTEHK